MSHGGAREGSGNKHKWTDSQGNPIPTKTIRIPETITKEEVEEFIKEKINASDK